MKNIFKQINLFDESHDLISWEDYDAWLRLAKLNINFHFIDEFLSYINQDDGNNLSSKKRINNIFSIKDKYLDKIILVYQIGLLLSCLKTIQKLNILLKQKYIFQKLIFKFEIFNENKADIIIFVE